MVTLTTIATLLIVTFICRTLFWKKQAIDAFKQLSEIVPSKDYLDLELATNEQILAELFKRPNNRLMLLIPEEKGPDLLVNIHTMNLSPQMALTMLQRTYDGINGLRPKDGE